HQPHVVRHIRLPETLRLLASGGYEAHARGPSPGAVHRGDGRARKSGVLRRAAASVRASSHDGKAGRLMLRVRREKNGTILVSMDKSTAEVLRELPRKLRSIL